MPGSLNARDISKSYAAVQVLDRVSLVVAPGDRVGIVGPNGIGKSTLLRVLAGLEAPDTGRVVCAGAVGYLPQELEARAGETVRGYLARRTGVDAAEQEMDELAARLADEHELTGAYTAALDRFLALGGEDFDARAASVLDDVGLGRRSDRELRTRSRAARPPGRRWPRSCSPASTCSCSTSRRTTSTSPGSSDSNGFSTGWRPASCSSRTTATSSTGRSIASWRSKRRRGRCTSTPAPGRSTRRRARGRAPQHEAAYATTSARSDRYSAAPRRAAQRRRARRRRDGRPARRRTPCAARSTRPATTSSGSRRSRSRGRRGSCRWSSPRRRRRGRSSSSPARSSQVGSFTLGPVDLELRFGDRLAVIGANGTGKTTLIRALTGELPLARGTRRVGPAVVFGGADAGARPLLGVRSSTTSPSSRGSRRPTRARCSRSSRSEPTTSGAPRRRSRRASAPAPGSRCCPPGASTASSSTSRPTTSTSRRSKSSKPPSRPTRAASSSSRMTGAS